MLPFGYVAHDKAADPSAQLDAAITVGADGVVRELAVTWPGWTYAVTGARPPPPLQRRPKTPGRSGGRPATARRSARWRDSGECRTAVICQGSSSLRRRAKASIVR